MNPELLKVKINASISTQDNARLKHFALELRTYLFEPDKSFEQYFVVLLELLNQKNLLELDSSWDFFDTFKNCRELLSDLQRQKYLSSIESAYDAFGEISYEQIKKSIYQAITVKDVDELAKSLHALEEGLSSVYHFPQEIFLFIINLLNDKNFQELEYAWHFLTFLELNWELISESQKALLILTLEVTYSKFSGWMARFVISGTLGQFFADERAFEVLCRLNKLDNEDHRQFIPHGLEHIIKDSLDKELSKKAYICLLEMKDDFSEIVREEVDESLQKLHNRNLV